MRLVGVVAEDVEQLKTLFRKIFAGREVDLEVLGRLLGGAVEECGDEVWSRLTRQALGLKVCPCVCGGTSAFGSILSGAWGLSLRVRGNPLVHNGYMPEYPKSHRIDMDLKWIRRDAGRAVYNKARALIKMLKPQLLPEEGQPVRNAEGDWVACFRWGQEPAASTKDFKLYVTGSQYMFEHLTSSRITWETKKARDEIVQILSEGA